MMEGRRGRDTKMTDTVLNDILEYTHKNYTNCDFKAATVCNRFQICSSSFSYQFKQKVGVTFRSYLVALKINAIKEAIKKKYDIKTKEILEIVKVGSESNISYFFKRETGMTITMYKRMLVSKCEI